MSIAAVQRFDGFDKTSEILDSFRGGIQPVRLSPVYRGALAIVALAMVLLPLVYVALVGGAAYGVYWYATHGWALLAGMGSAKLRGLAFITPLLAGGLLVLFMIKPLFARPARRDEPQRLSPDDEPLLFAFVERVCTTVGAPRPREIHIDGQVNASASFRRGFLSLFVDDLVLTLGLPLVAGLSLPQLAGVLAHEFGHFGQRAGMRLSYVIRTVNAWFARVVYERDKYDEQLLDAAKNSDYRLQIMLWVALGFIWLSRKILWVLMMIGHTLSSFLLRQMEFDADRNEARLVGREVARSTFGDIFYLSIGFRQTVMSLDGLRQQRQLGDRFPRLVAANRRHLAGRAPRLYEDFLAQSKTGVFDTHPADRDRIASIAREAEAGVFASDLPATALFRDFEAVEKSFSSAFYRDVFGDRFDEGELVPVDESVAAQQQYADDADVLERYLERDPNASWPFPLPLQLAAPSADPVAELQAARQAMVAQRENVAEEVTAHAAACGRLRSALVAENALRSGFSIEAKTFDLQGTELPDAVRARDEAAAAIAGIEARLWTLEQVPARRLMTALSLPGAPGLDISRFLSCAAFLHKIHPRLTELVKLDFIMGPLASWVQADNSLQASTRLGEVTAQVRSLLESLAGDLAPQPYPFEDRGTGMTLARFARLDEPLGRTAEDLSQAASVVIGSLFSLSTHLLAQLARWAEQVEGSLGLEPLERPDSAD